MNISDNSFEVPVTEWSQKISVQKYCEYNECDIILLAK